MRKNVFYALIILAQMMWAGTVTTPENIPAYYSDADGKKGTGLYNALNTITNRGFSSLGYDGAITAYQQSDVYPTDPNHPDYVAEKAGKLWDMYGACTFTLGDECGNYNGECDCYNREHSIPKSWWGGNKNNMYSDIFHLVPTDGYVNNRRSAYAFGEVQNTTYTYNGCKLGSSVSSISTDRNTLLGTTATCSGTVFEPKDEYKGDFARGYLGMIAKYSNTTYSITSGSGGLIFESFSNTQHFGLTQYGIVLLMKWHREDPVSRKEIDRNNGIQKTQGNRNPFIDYPYLAEFIWGEHAGETVDMSMLMPSTDTAFIPGVSSGWRGEVTPPTPPTPPTPAVKYGLKWSVYGWTIQTDSIEENQRPSEMPDEPHSCSSVSDVFVGWTDAPIIDSLDEAPLTLYKALNELPVITEDITLYAVFAHMEIAEEEAGGEGSEPQIANETIVMSEQGFANAADVTSVEQGYVTITFTNGSNNTKYYESGTAVRVYGGGTMTVAGPGMKEIELTFGTGDKDNTITTDVGSYVEPKWTGEADEVTFTVGGSSGHRKIATVKVTFSSEEGPTIIYSRFITNCPTATEVENVTTNEPAKKILIGNHIYIIIGEQVFDFSGQKVK